MQSPNPFIALSVLVAVSAAGALPAAAESNGYRRPQPAQASQTVPSDSASPSLTAEQPDGQPRINQPIDQRVSRQSDLLDQLQTESEIRQQLNQSRFRTSDRPLSPETDALRYEQEVQQQINLQNMRTPSTSPSGMLDRLQFEQRVRQRLQTPPSPAPESPTPRETAPTQLRQELAQAAGQGDKPQASQVANQPISQAANQSTNQSTSQAPSQSANSLTRSSGQAITSASHSASHSARRPSATSTPASSPAASTPAGSAPAAPEPATEPAAPAVVSAEPAKPAAQSESAAQPAPATPESTTASTPNPNSREARQARLEARREARRQARREAAAAREAARATAQTSVAAAQPGEVPAGEVPSGEIQPSQTQAEPQTRQAEATEAQTNQPQANQPQTRESQASPGETPAVSATPSLEGQTEARETETSRDVGSGQPGANEARESQANSSGGEPRAAETAEAAKATNETPRAESAETERAETQTAETEVAEAERAETKPAEAESAAIESAEAELAEAESTETESDKTESAEAQPAATEPVATESAETERAAAESTETESGKTELAESEPAATESAESTPEATVIEAASEAAASEAAGSATKPEPTEGAAVEAAQSPTVPLESQPLDLPGDAPAPSEPPRAGDPGRSDRIDPGENIFSADDFSTDAAAPDYLDPDPNPLSFPTEPDEVEIVGTQPITLRQAIQLALRNNPELRQAQFQLERSQADLRRAEASNLPTLDALAGFSQSGTETGSTVPDTLTNSITGEEQPNVVADPDNPTQTIPNPRIGDVVRTYQDRTTLSVGIELNYSIFTSGQRPALIRAAEQQVRLQQLDLERQTEQLILETVGDYYNLQQAGAQVNIFRANLAQAEQSLRDAQALERAGVGTRFDVLQAEVDVANARQRLTQQLSDLEVSQRQISQRLNISQSLDVSAADPIEVAGVWDLSLEESIVEAFKNRAELEQQLVQREIAEQNRRAALADLGPQVGFQGAFNVSSEDFELNGGPNYNYSLALNARMRLYDGGEARSRANAQESNISIAEAAFESAKEQIRFDIERGYSQLNASFTNIQTTALAVEQATEALRLARLRFQAGVGTQTDVLRQQSVLAEAQVNNLTAILDYNRALAVLQRGVSNYPEGFLNEQP